MKIRMSYSKTGLDLTKRFEGCKFKAYRDVAGILTIAYGHTKGVILGMTCTQEQADFWLMQDITEAANAVNRFVIPQLTQPEFDALVDFVFNLGIGAFYKSTMLKDINAGNFVAAAAQFPLWDHAAGKVVSGLLHRRLAEQAEFEETAS